MMKKRGVVLTIGLFVLAFAFQVSAIEGNSSNYGIQASIGYSGDSDSSSNYQVKEYLGDYPVGNQTQNDYEMFLGALLNEYPVLKNTSFNFSGYPDRNNNIWFKENTSLNFSTESLQYHDGNLNLYLCNSSDVSSSGCIDNTLCSGFTDNQNASCSFSTGNDSYSSIIYPRIYDEINIPARNHPSINFSVDTIKPIANVFNVNIISNATDNINFSCTDAHSGCQDIFYFYFSSFMNCSENLGNYTNQINYSYLEGNGTYTNLTLGLSQQATQNVYYFKPDGHATGEGICLMVFDYVGHNGTSLSDSTNVVPNITNSELYNCTLYPPFTLNNVFCNNSIINSTKMNDVRITDSFIHGTTFYNGILNNSYVKTSTITNSSIWDSYFWDLDFSNLIIDENLYFDGYANYRNQSYFAPQNISQIYGLPPEAVGTLDLDSNYVRNGSILSFTYSSPGIGYKVVINTTPINSIETSTILTYNQQTSQLLGSVNVTQEVSSNYTLYYTVTDSVGNNYHLNKSIYVDNIDPTGRIFINSSGTSRIAEAHQEYTGSPFVNLNLNYSDNYNVQECRYKNSGYNFTSWESCKTQKEWILEDVQGVKTVHYEIKDMAGNIIALTDTINYNSTAFFLDGTPPNPATVEDDGLYTNSNNTLHVRLSNASDPESELLSSEIIYYYRVINQFTNITSWTYAGISTDIYIRNLTLIEGQNYTIQINTTNRANLGSISSSDGIIVDYTAPSLVTISGMISAQGYTDTRSPYLEFTSTDSTSGVYSYSYEINMNNDSTPDNIPELTNNVTFYNLQEGIHYLHIKAIDNANNWGPTAHLTVGVDLTAPTIPTMQSSVYQSNTTQITFTWTESTDALSGVSGYHLEVEDLNGTSILSQLTGNVTSYTSTIFEKDKIYFAKVRAIDNAGIYSKFSNEFYTETEDLIITNIKPSGDVASASPIINLQTNKVAECYYREMSPNLNPTEKNFYFTNSTYHETTLTLNGTQAYIYRVKCIDSFGNEIEQDISFTTKYEELPDSIEILYLDTKSYFINEISTISINVTKNNVGLGELSRQSFKLYIDNVEITDHTILDKGQGLYEIQLVYSEIIANKSIVVDYGSVAGTPGVISFTPISITIQFGKKGVQLMGMSEGLGVPDTGFNETDVKTTPGNRITYYDFDGENTIGIGTDATPMGTGSDENTLELNANANDGNQYIFLTQTSNVIPKRETDLKEKQFLDLTFPAFGTSGKENLHSIKTRFNYPKVKLISTEIENATLSKGSYQLVLINRGTDEFGTKIIEVKVI